MFLLDGNRCLRFKYWLDIFECLDMPENTVDVLHSARVFGSNRSTVVEMPIDLGLYFLAPGKWPAMDEGNLQMTGIPLIISQFYFTTL